MIWAVLALVGVPLWWRAAGILTVVGRLHAVRGRHGDIGDQPALEPVPTAQRRDEVQGPPWT